MTGPRSKRPASTRPGCQAAYTHSTPQLEGRARRMFKNVISSEDELRAIMGEPNPRSLDKETTYLTEACIRFISKAPFMLLATSGKNGRCDVAPKGDPAGFVRVLDEKHLVIPDRPGNKRFDGLRNIFENPHIGLIFLVPGRQGDAARQRPRLDHTRRGAARH